MYCHLEADSYTTSLNISLYFQVSGFYCQICLQMLLDSLPFVMFGCHFHIVGPYRPFTVSRTFETLPITGFLL